MDMALALGALRRMQDHGLPFAVVKLMLIFQNRQTKSVAESGHACSSKSCVELGNKLAPACWSVCVRECRLQMPVKRAVASELQNLTALNMGRLLCRLISVQHHPP